MNCLTKMAQFSMKRVAISQSNYIPWKGYFDLINDVDLFVFYDDVQYTTRDWRNRNLIKTPNGLFWLSIPVGSNRRRLINEVEINTHDWQHSHWTTICQFYKKSKYFNRYNEYFEDVYLNRKWKNLSVLNQYLVESISRNFLQISTEFANSTEYFRKGEKQEAMCSLVLSTGATSYISGPAAKAYLEPSVFENLNIELIWKEYSGYPEYFQFYDPFCHNVSILDLLFHTGPDAPFYIWGWRELQK